MTINSSNPNFTACNTLELNIMYKYNQMLYNKNILDNIFNLTDQFLFTTRDYD